MRAPVFVTTLLTFALVAVGQTSRGTVSGVVTDPADAVVPGATITLTGSDTGLSRTSTTNDEGAYRFDAVDLGTYSVQITATGFGALTKTNVTVNANQTSAVDAQLTLGGQQITVDVVSEAGAALQTEAPVRGGNISTRQVVDLPYAGRNPTALALTLPGISTNRSGVGIATFSVNGARSRSNNFLIDGTENNDISVAGQGLQLANPDAVQEVSIQTSNYDSEFGRSGGGVINTITKSGTNDFNGTLSFLYDSRTDDALTSRESRVASNILRGEPPSGTEYFAAGTLGGPIVRNRTFFFGYYQENRQRSTSQANFVTPTAAGRARLRQLFPAGASPNVDLLLGVTANSVGTASPIPIALGTVGGVNRGDIEFGTFTRNYAQLNTNRQYLIRIDHSISDNDQLSGRFISDRSDNPVATPGFEGFDAATFNRNYNFQTAYTRVFSPTVTNELRLAYNRIQFGFPLVDPEGLGGTLSNIVFGTNVANLGIAVNLPQGRTANNYQIQDTATKIYGNHTFRGGFDFLRQIATQSAPFNERGSLNYSTSTGFSAFANFVDDFGGTSGAVSRDFGSSLYFPSLYRTAVFFQDRWKATEALTLTLGLRYERFGTPFNTLQTPAFTGLFNIDPTTRTGPFNQPNQVESDKNNFAPTIGIAYSPSFTEGILGTLVGERRTVLRAGYQIGYDSFFNNIASNASSSSPNTIVTTINSSINAGARGLSNFSTRFPGTAATLTPLSGQTLIDPNLVNPYYQRYSAGLQRELPYNLIVDVSYVGSKGTRLFIQEDLNPQVPAALRSAIPAGYPNCAQGTNVTGAQATAQFPTGTLCPLSGRLDNLQGTRNTRTNGGSSTYHSGQLEVRRRFADNFTITGAYTFSKLIDNASDVFGIGVATTTANSAVPSILGGERLDRGVGNFDRPHRASFTYVYEIPFFREQRGFVGRALGGFQISGVTSFESGVPYTIFNGLDADSIGGGLDRPDFNPNGQPGTRAIPFITVASATGSTVAATNPCSITTVGTIIYTTAPSAAGSCINPADARFIGLLANVGRTGNLGRNTERSTGINSWNVNILKRTRLTEGTSVEFRTEFYNIFNHPQYLTGSISPFSPGGGTIDSNLTTAADGRFLNPNTPVTDGGGRVIRYQVKLLF
ncbi:MAG: carboxypeptidase regulatory-like domain-containing protein [Acidobacteriota bacterium]|nr:carboxypeptidase regulatory-like domain-containing protein [Acidobacteriota bacterium]